MKRFIDILREYEDHGRPMLEPMVLYRSVSIPELVSVAFSGMVRGGGNKFSGDTRSLVFFGDTLNDNLIGQGEDHSRYAGYSLRDHSVHRDAKTNNEDIVELAQLCSVILKRLSEKKQWRIDQSVFDKLSQGDESIARRISSDYGRYDSAFGARMRELLDALERRRTLQNDYMDHHRVASRAFKATRQNWQVTSAVLVTHPLDGGEVYTGEHSMHDGDEYGFHSGDVTLDDVAEVKLYCDRKLVATIAPDAILKTLRAMGVDTEPYLH